MDNSLFVVFMIVGLGDLNRIGTFQLNTMKLTILWRQLVMPCWYQGSSKINKLTLHLRSVGLVGSIHCSAYIMGILFIYLSSKVPLKPPPPAAPFSSGWWNIFTAILICKHANLWVIVGLSRSQTKTGLRSPTVLVQLEPKLTNQELRFVFTIKIANYTLGCSLWSQK